MKTISLRTFGLFLVYKKSIQSPNSHGLLPLRDQSPERVGGGGGGRPEEFLLGGIT